MKKDIDVIGLGDLMIDFTFAGTDERGISVYARNPAGSMANVLSQVVKLGGSAVLVTTLGQDEHSRYLFETAEKLGIDMSCVRYGTLPTRFMFAYCDADNNRRFSDYRSPRNEAQTRMEQVDTDKLKRSHFLDIKAILFEPEDPMTETMERMLTLAGENGVTAAIDMQWRGFPLRSEARAELVGRAKRCGVVKVTDEELAYFYDATGLEDGTDRVFVDSATELVAVTLGERGCFLRTRNASAYCATYDVPVKDTTGAGDSFMGALLYRLSRWGRAIGELSAQELTELADFCNACASYSTESWGSLLGMASHKDVELVRKSVPKLELEHATEVTAPRFISAETTVVI